MIRPAKFFDTLRIIELLDEMQAKSKYAGRVEVDHKAAHRLIQQLIQRHGFIHDGGALVMVAIRDQRVEGFMVGLLDRVYHVGDRLVANDMYLYCSEKAHPTDFLKLFDAYISWAANNPKVVEIKASWTDTIEGAERIEKVYESKGFRRCGAIFEKAIERSQLPVLAKEEVTA